MILPTNARFTIIRSWRLQKLLPNSQIVLWIDEGVPDLPTIVSPYCTLTADAYNDCSCALIFICDKGPLNLFQNANMVFVPPGGHADIANKLVADFYGINYERIKADAIKHAAVEFGGECADKHSLRYLFILNTIIRGRPPAVIGSWGAILAPDRTRGRFNQLSRTWLRLTFY